MNAEKITSIKEFCNDENEGYVVTTTEQVITFGIGSEQSCCERWGYFTTNDDVSEFINAELLNITVVDSELNSTVFLERCNEQRVNPKSDECRMMFINFETSNGTLQFVAYNTHNGFYSHLAFINSRQLTESVKL